MHGIGLNPSRLGAAGGGGGGGGLAPRGKVIAQPAIASCCASAEPVTVITNHGLYREMSVTVITNHGLYREMSVTVITNHGLYREMSVTVITNHGL